MDSIVTPEHFYALFYGFGKYTTIKKCSASFHLPSLSLSLSTDLSLSLAVLSFTRSFAIARSLSFTCSLVVCLYPYSPSRIRYFRLLSSSLLCARFHFSVIYSHCVLAYRFPGNCYDSQPRSHAVIILLVSDSTRILSPTFVCHNRPSAK